MDSRSIIIDDILADIDHLREELFDLPDAVSWLTALYEKWQEKSKEVSKYYA